MTTKVEMTTAPKAVEHAHGVSHPPYIDMVKTAIKHVASHKGATLVAIRKYIAETYNLDYKFKAVSFEFYIWMKEGEISSSWW